MEYKIARLERYGHPASLVFVDVDHFKQVNDTWGHSAGDRVLREFCGIISGCLPTTDVLGRWVVKNLLSCYLIQGRPAQSWSQSVPDKPLQHCFEGVGRVTASFGVAACRSGGELAAWVERADAALYLAKDRGRNCVEVEWGGDADAVEKVTPGFIGIIWRKEYECAHPNIDQQHQILFEVANQLLAAVLGDHPKDEVMGLINVSLAEVVRHFDDEERIIEAGGFPEVEAHRQIHHQLVARAKQLAERYTEGKLEIGELFTFLAHDVVARHMLADDRKFFPYVAAPHH